MSSFFSTISKGSTQVLFRGGKMFDKLIEKLTRLNWREDCPSKNVWIFIKKRWVCLLFWSSGQVVFYKVN
jgi:hypothetical protein